LPLGLVYREIPTRKAGGKALLSPAGKRYIKKGDCKYICEHKHSKAHKCSGTLTRHPDGKLEDRVNHSLDCPGHPTPTREKQSKTYTYICHTRNVIFHCTGYLDLHIG